MKSLKPSLLALALAMTGAQAYAATYSASEIINAGQTYTFENGLIATGSKAFSDSFTFNLGSGVGGASFLFNFALPSSPSTSFAVNYLGGALAVSGGNIGSSYSYIDEEGETISFSTLDKVQYTFALSDLSSGVTTINVSGSFAAEFPTSRNYSLTVAALPAAAVPEPESYALFLLGLGLMAGIARRQSKSN